MVYGYYVSAITQKPVCRDFYPVTRQAVARSWAGLSSAT